MRGFRTVASRRGMTIYRQPWQDGKVLYLLSQK
jgi:hypothetical protein